ncbi:MAG: type II secretion system F family protein, partial [Terriglobales bacterium]
MPILLAVLVFLTITIVVFAFAAATVAPSSVLGARLREIGWQRPKEQHKAPIRERFQQALDPFSRALPISPTDVSKTRAWLIQAGYRDPQHVSIYRGLRVVFAGVGLLVAFFISGFSSPFLLAGLFGLGFFIPRFLLKRQMQKRQLRIRLALPDALDLTVICVEAGLPLDQALTRVGSDLSHAHPELADEFHLFDLENRAGKPRVEALRNLAARTGVEDVRSLVGTLIQTDRFGT